jgi:hypothetical protein
VNMIVYIDGVPTKVQNDLRIVYDNIFVDEDHANSELHVVATSEGLVMDVINNETIVASSCSLAQDLADDVIG